MLTHIYVFLKPESLLISIKFVSSRPTMFTDAFCQLVHPIENSVHLTCNIKKRNVTLRSWPIINKYVYAYIVSNFFLFMCTIKKRDTYSV